MNSIFLYLAMAAPAMLCQDSSNVVAPKQDSIKSVVTVFYFGGSDCTVCMRPENIANIRRLREELPKIHKEASFKFVLVVMDEELDRGIQYASKYPHWNEVSIGDFYNNELMLEHLNGTDPPGVPQLMIFRDSLANREKYSVPLLRARTLLLDLVGGHQIEKWILDGYPLRN